MNTKDISVITLFPEFFSVWQSYGVANKVFKQNLISLKTLNPRDYTTDIHQSVDDKPFGGSCGMLMKYEPLSKAIDDAKAQSTINNQTNLTIYLSPQGKHITQATIENLSHYDHLTLLCGRYEGIDQRVIDKHVDLELTLGDFVMSGGEIAAMAVLDALVRLHPQSLGNNNSYKQDSFANGLLKQPQYTRPETIDNMSVPKILLSGNHKKIAEWNKQQSIEATRAKRPDLLKEYNVPTKKN